MNNVNKEDSLTLEILEAVERNEELTQRNLASELGVALGLANSYLKRCARKGYIKIQQAPANRYLYYLTPKGFSEKSRLSAKYLSTSFDLYRRASKSFTLIYTQCQRVGQRKLLLCGLSELSEIAYIRAQEFDIELSGIWEPNNSVSEHLGLPVWRKFEDASDSDAYLVTALRDPQDIQQQLFQKAGDKDVLAPEILGLNTSVQVEPGDD